MNWVKGTTPRGNMGIGGHRGNAPADNLNHRVGNIGGSATWKTGSPRGTDLRTGGHRARLRGEDIVRIDSLAGKHPVWLITCAQDVSPPCFVLKVERGSLGHTGAQSVQAMQWAGAVMGELAPGVKAEVADNEEFRAFCDKSAGTWADAEAYNNFQAVWAAEVLQDRAFLLKMPYELGLTNLEAHGEGAEAKARMRMFAMLPDIKRPGSPAMNKLGKIVVADLFTENLDRLGLSYTVQGADTPWGANSLTSFLDGRSGSAVDIRNFGNVVFQLTNDASFDPIGMDFFHPTQSVRGMFDALPEGATWVSGEVLKSAAGRREFAVRVIDTLNKRFTELGTYTQVDGAGRRTQVPPSPALLLDAACTERFAAGMDSGVHRLETFVRQRHWRGGPPKGLESRMRYLGWL